MTVSDIRERPTLECDVVMKGGITSGVVYPKALRRLGATYRLRSVGGASAGAIGAAIGAAAEYGREGGGFDRMAALPDELGEGRLAALFQPQKETKPLLRLMLVLAGSAKPGKPSTGVKRLVEVMIALVVGFPLASIIGLLPGAAVVVVGVWNLDDVTGWLLLVAGVVIAKVGWLMAVSWRAFRKLTVAVPANQFGICRGLGASAAKPGFTDWLSDRIDDVAGLSQEQRPLTFGHLKAVDIDLQMVSTCLSQGRPYSLPWSARTFFYDPATWRTLFPAHVVDALEAAPTSTDKAEESQSTWEDGLAAAASPALRRLPAPEHLPVIVATRLSLSFPLLISAIPLWTIDYRSKETRNAIDAYRDAVKAKQPLPTSGLEFAKLWFTDGGLCSNFPVHLFDSALSSRPTFAINLGSFATGREPSPDQHLNVEFARDNNAVLPFIDVIPEKGLKAVTGFAGHAVNTARNWQDSSHLGFPGYRDRIARVLQTKTEGGLNLYMERDTITRLAERGEAAADLMVEQFTTDKYDGATGWDNHRWVRYRALMTVLPQWLESYARGKSVLDITPADAPSYKFPTAASRDLAEELSVAMDAAAAIVTGADAKALDDLTAAPRPKGMIRRIPTT